MLCLSGESTSNDGRFEPKLVDPIDIGDIAGIYYSMAVLMRLGSGPKSNRVIVICFVCQGDTYVEQSVVTKLRAISETAGGTFASCFVVCFVSVGGHCNICGHSNSENLHRPDDLSAGHWAGTFGEGDVVGAGEFFKT